MGLWHIVARSLFAYAFLLALMRVSGKRTISQTTTFEFIFVLILGDMIDDALWAEVPISAFVVATGTLVLSEVAVGLLTAGSRTMARLILGVPSDVMRDGEIVRETLRKERIAEKEADAVLRGKGVTRAGRQRVRVAQLDGGGRAVVELYDWARSVMRKDAERLRRRS